MEQTLVVVFPSVSARDKARQDAKIESIPANITGTTEEGRPFLLSEGNENRALWWKNHGALISIRPDGDEVVSQRRCSYGHDAECTTPEGCPGAGNFYWLCRASDPP